MTDNERCEFWIGLCPVVFIVGGCLLIAAVNGVR